ncbi:hypothetical protein D3C81_1287640 [compost metagenome]
MERLGEFLLTGFQRCFRALLLGDVAQSGDDTSLVADADLPAGNHTGQRLAVLVLHDDRYIAQALFADDPFNPLQAFCRGVPQADFFGGVADNVGGAPAESLGKTVIDLDELAAVLAGDADRVRADLEQRGKFLFRGHQPLLALDLISDVEQGAGHAQRRAVVVTVEAGAAFQIARTAVRQLHAISQLIIARRAFTQAAVGVAHAVALFAGYAFKKLFKRFMKRYRFEPVQLRGPRRAVEHAAGDVPVPRAELCRVQR